jgi:hypothetical protein
MRELRFLSLVVILNVIRYAVGAIVEPILIFPGLFGAMESDASYFNTTFTQLDWVTSFFYNFVVWLCCVWAFHHMRPAFRGNDVVASLKSFALMWVFFASVSAVYMNHYSHGKAFYAWNIADALLMFAVVAIGNGLLYRRIMGTYAVDAKALASIAD